MEMYEEEKKRLDETLKIMRNEIIELQRKIDELSKTGTTLSYEDRKRGMHLQINSKFDFEMSNLNKIERSLSIPYFGRIDFNRNADHGGNKIYIGKSGIMANGQTIVTDWRAPVCSLYYDSEIGKVNFKSPSGLETGYLNLKRQINIKDGKLLDVQDSSLVSNDELLKPYLSTNADNKMKIIIASIQKEQNSIIRRNPDDNIIVQGVAGSGKTSVALHRIAYLIYNLGNNISSDQFLVLGPNRYFLNYISSILPELETSPVDQKTLLDFCNDYLDEKAKLGLKDDSLTTKHIKDEELYKKVQSLKTSLEYKNLIDQFMSEFYANNLVEEDFSIDGNIIFTKEEVYDTLFMSNKPYPDFNRANIYLVNKFKNNQSIIYDNLNRQYRDIYVKLSKDDPERKKAIEKSLQLDKLIKKDGVKLLKNYLKKLRKSPINIYKLFLSDFDKYNINHFSTQEKLLLAKETLLDLKNKKISFVDIPALLHLNYLYTGKKTKYKYIAIDEAQDYGLFHFQALREIADKSIFSVYGDLAQSIYSYRSINSWDEVKDTVFPSSSIIELNRSYRTTIEITENANQVLEYMNLGKATPVIRHGGEVLFSDCANDINYKINKINEWKEKGYNTIAIICKEEMEAKKVHSDLEKKGIDIKYLSSKDSEYSGGVFVLTSTSAKGLEFDTVIVNDASEKRYNSDSEIDMHLLYVASTRALHEQVILYNQKITKPYSAINKKKSVDAKRMIKHL